MERVEAYTAELSHDVMFSVDEESVTDAMNLLQHIATAVEKETRI